jgi:polysaccharide export outer membrane protein
MREDWEKFFSRSHLFSPMFFILRFGLFAGIAAAWMLSVSLIWGGSVRAEERRNWLKVSSRPAPTAFPKPITVSVSSFPEASYRYRLGPGDKLVMSVFKISGYEASVQVLSDGTINLPRLGTMDVWGLTMDEARQRITNGYSQILRRPIVYLDLVEQRPVRVTVTGQVGRPGVFTLPVNSQGRFSSDEELGSGGGWPTMVDVIQRAGGVAAMGDLSRLELLRPSHQRGASSKRYVFDYLTVLKQGGFAPNPLIYDGDSIRVLKANAPINADLITTASSNFAPSTIAVKVVGEVALPGLVEIPSNAPLSQAILASGGLSSRASVSRVDLIRMDGEGRTTIKQMSFSPGSEMSSANNPPLRSGDVVVVDRNILAKFTDGMNLALEPLDPIVDAASVLRILGLPGAGN